MKSPEFKVNEEIPKKYTCDGENVNPPLEISNIPDKTKSLALIVDDPDTPNGTFTHWIVWNIPPKEKIDEDTIPGEQGLSDFKKIDYHGPCPPSGEHRYYFKLYALDTILNLDKKISREELIPEMQNHIIDSCNTVGRYSKKVLIKNKGGELE